MQLPYLYTYNLGVHYISFWLQQCIYVNTGREDLCWHSCVQPETAEKWYAEGPRYVKLLKKTFGINLHIVFA